MARKSVTEQIMDQYGLSPDKPIKLSDFDPDDGEGFKSKSGAQRQLRKDLMRIRVLQEALYAEHKQSLLIVLQAMDTGGKDGTIEHVCGAVNPQGVVVTPFKVPSAEELAHDFLWRVHKVTPARGMIAVFNRSHYEDVLVVRVHDLAPKEVWSQRYELINQFEKHLTANGVVILKFFLHISKAEQKERLLDRLNTPDKQWKFAVGDLKERGLWDQYQEAYEDALNKCTTAAAPWYVIPANRKWYRNYVVARIIRQTLEAMNPQFPQPAEDLSQVVIED
ncbi:MAG: polyphosphate kinase 2 family protein [Anaerolineae bacterium]